jgi:hypothetical protein
MRRLPLVLFVLVIASCGSPSPTAPSPAVEPPASAAGFEVYGYIIDTKAWPLAGVTVEIVDGPHAGSSAETDARGVYSFRVPAASSSRTTVVATKEGYLPATRTFDLLGPAARVYIPFQLQSTTPPVNLTCTYTLTWDAHASCSQLTAEARHRSYRVRLVPSGTAFTVVPLQGEFHAFHMSVGVAGNSVGFDTDTDLFQDAVLERVSPTSFLRIWGWGDATVTDGRPIVAPFMGEFLYCPSEVPGTGRCSVTPTACSSEQHQLMLTRL